MADDRLLLESFTRRMCSMPHRIITCGRPQFVTANRHPITNSLHHEMCSKFAAENLIEYQIKRVVEFEALHASRLRQVEEAINPEVRDFLQVSPT